jgi:hypothetical protein
MRSAAYLEPQVEGDYLFAGETPVCAYWLTRCEGFSVRDGKRELGVVESIACDWPLGRAETLRLRSGRARTLVPAENVVAVVPAQQLLLAKHPARLHLHSRRPRRSSLQLRMTAFAEAAAPRFRRGSVACRDGARVAWTDAGRAAGKGGAFAARGCRAARPHVVAVVRAAARTLAHSVSAARAYVARLSHAIRQSPRLRNTVESARVRLRPR